MGAKLGAYVKELKGVSCIAAPLVAVTVLQYLLQVVSVMMVGHLDELSLSAVSIASSFTSVTGFSILFVMAGALGTLCGQAYGAEQYQTLGIYTYSAIISLIPVCLPISLLWIFTDKILIFVGQDHAISLEARKYSIWLIPNLFSYAILQSLICYFQTQSLILPMLFSTCATLCFHIPLCWALIFKLELGSIGAALAIGLSYWLNVIFLGFYVKYSSSCEKTRVQFSKDVFPCIGEFLRLAFPSAVMVCLEWWSYEVLILLSGLLRNPKLETSVLSICLTITTVHYFIPYGLGATARRARQLPGACYYGLNYFIPYGLGATASTRVSNELGAGNPQAAKVAVSAVMVLAVVEVVIVSTTLFCCRYILGYAFSSEKEIVDHVTSMVPLICLSIIMDSLQAVLSGVTRGSGWQHIGAYVNLGAYYLVGAPVAAVLAFFLHLRGKGLWIGLATGSTVQATLLALITSFTNWNKQASKARERILEGDSE